MMGDILRRAVEESYREAKEAKAAREAATLDISDIGKVAILRDFAERYQAMLKGCQFEVGQFVTARRDSPYMRGGEPAIVLEVREPDDVLRPYLENGNNHSGAWFDMRIAVACRSGEVAEHWVQSCHYEPWTGDGGEP